MDQETETVQVRSATPAEEMRLEQSPETIAALNRTATPAPEEVTAALERAQQHQRRQLYVRIQRNMQAHAAGEKARFCGWARLSPYYMDSVSDHFFFAGYDGVPFDQAIRGGGV
jgi:hypothetical protein